MVVGMKVSRRDLDSAFHIRSVAYWSSSNLLINFPPEIEMQLRVLSEFDSFSSDAVVVKPDLHQDWAVSLWYHSLNPETPRMLYWVNTSGRTRYSHVELFEGALLVTWQCLGYVAVMLILVQYAKHAFFWPIKTKSL